jgi:hypothetical protein
MCLFWTFSRFYSTTFDVILIVMDVLIGEEQNLFGK